MNICYMSKVNGKLISSRSEIKFIKNREIANELSKIKDTQFPLIYWIEIRYDEEPEWGDGKIEELKYIKLKDYGIFLKGD